MYEPPTLATDEMVLRLLLAMALGAVIGLEREWRDRTAGLRTHMLVCIGSAVFTIISTYAFGEYYTQLPDGTRVIADPARISAQVVSGIGFLGAGAIFQGRGSVKGLTTAGSLWMMAAIGMAVGAGEYEIATVSTLMIVVVLAVLRQASRRIKRMRHRTKARIELQISRPEGYRALFDTLEEHSVIVRRLLTSDPVDEAAERSVSIDVDMPPQEGLAEVTTDLLATRGIHSVAVEEIG